VGGDLGVYNCLNDFGGLQKDENEPWTAVRRGKKSINQRVAWDQRLVKTIFRNEGEKNSTGELNKKSQNPKGVIGRIS